MSDTPEVKESPKEKPLDVPGRAITLGRAVRWYDLMRRIGYDRIMNGARPDAQAPPKPEPEASSALAVFRENFGQRPAATQTMTFDFEHIFNEIIEGGLLYDLAAVVLDISVEDAEAADVATFREALGPFVSACFVLLHGVLNPAMPSG